VSECVCCMYVHVCILCISVFVALRVYLVSLGQPSGGICLYHASVGVKGFISSRDVAYARVCVCVCVFVCL
jgi:hypothetical protein